MTAPRMRFLQHAPDVYEATLALTQAAKKDLDPTLVELVLLRASQVNHCAFCIDMHATDARKAGESEQRINLLNAWEEAGEIYTGKERAALALTEAVTVLTDGFVPDEVFERAAAHFSEPELARLVSLIATINVWNRINVAFRTPVGRMR
ncbi:carboxymuconolactone decarboxylase family protein [Streptoverticillium reticulum]|uniref:carboxymuconolactone decarboxylase family protein n=1 Tax=Streptoverticillium reticulum TaxID=1433415 RepID=UPI0039BFB1CD